MNEEAIHQCSFCAKAEDEVLKLIGVPAKSLYICNECVARCQGIIEKEVGSGFTLGEHELPKPTQLKEWLDDYVIGQHEAKKMLSVAVYNHYKRINFVSNDVELTKSNILMIGPTGTGKTLLAQSLARKLNVPCAIVDATTLTEAGYVGEDVESIIQKLLINCDYDVKKAEFGIIYIDEIDKISRKSDNPSITRDVTGEGVQHALLKLIEGSVVSVPPQGGRKHPNAEYIQVDTKNILFICGGAFSGLDKVILNRTAKSGIGFSAKVNSLHDHQDASEIMTQVRPEDLVRYGLVAEFIGRLPMITVLRELDEGALIKILQEPKNALIKQFKEMFASENVELVFRNEAVRAIAQLAIIRKSGARGLRSVLETILMNTMYQMPAMTSLKRVIIDENVVLNDAEPLLEFHSEQQKSSS